MKNDFIAEVNATLGYFSPTRKIFIIFVVYVIFFPFLIAVPMDMSTVHFDFLEN